MNKINWTVIPLTDEELDKCHKHYKRHSKHYKRYVICNSQFKYGNSKSTICRLYGIFITCKICKKFKYIWKNHSESSHNIVISNIIKKTEPIEIFCSKSCSNISSDNSGTCPTSNKKRCRNI